jgi:hypothetical protein
MRTAPSNVVALTRARSTSKGVENSLDAARKSAWATWTAPLLSRLGSGGHV